MNSQLLLPSSGLVISFSDAAVTEVRVREGLKSLRKPLPILIFCFFPSF